MVLEKIGKIENYVHEPRSVASISLLVTDPLILKLYSMSKTKTPEKLGDDYVSPYAEDAHSIRNKCARKFLKDEILTEKIEPLTGMGFAIISDDMLDVAVWDNENPIVLKNRIYTYQLKASGLETELQDINKIGAFCVWELGIVNHERNAWMNYLQSGKTVNDKQVYLENVIEGEL